MYNLYLENWVSSEEEDELILQEKRQVMGYYGQTIKYRHPVYGKSYGILNQVKGTEDKTLILQWNKFPKFDESLENLKTNKGMLEPLCWNEERFMYELKPFQQNRNSTRFLIGSNRFKRLVIKYKDFVSKDMYYLTVNSLMKGTPVEWVSGSVCYKFKPCKFEPYDVDETFDLDFLTWEDKKIPFPVLKEIPSGSPKTSAKDIALTQKIKEGMANRGFKLPQDVMDKHEPYWEYSLGNSWSYFLDKKLPKKYQELRLPDGNMLPAWAYYMTRWFELNQETFVLPDLGLTELRNKLRNERWSEMAELNPSISSWSETQKNYTTWFDLELKDKIELYRWLEKKYPDGKALQYSEMFYGPSHIRLIESFPNQFGFRTERTFRDYISECDSEFVSNGASYLKSQDTSAYNKSYYKRDEVAWNAECDKLMQVSFIFRNKLTKEFLADGWQMCSKCNKPYRMSSQDLDDDPEFRLYGDWGESYNDIVVGKKDIDKSVEMPTVGSDNVINSPAKKSNASDRHTLEEHFCDKCRSNVTLDDLLCVVSGDVRLAAKKLLDKGIAPESMYKALLKEL